MKILKNTLKAEISRWDDPGDYPNNVASSPLPSYDYVSSVDGEITILMEEDDTIEDAEEVANCIEGVNITKWKKVLTLIPEEKS